MGKTLPSPNTLQGVARVISSDRVRRQVPSRIRTPIRTRVAPEPDSAGVEPANRVSSCVRMEIGGSSAAAAGEGRRTALADVVAECVKRWFQDTLKEAKAGDSSMQVLVGQMYYSGYGVPRDPQKGRAWINRASKSRSSVWKVGEKHPGYNASDSDSDDMKEDGK